MITAETRTSKALILAAGLGTRLRPVTDTLPKALVKVGGKTLLERAIHHLRDNGITEMIVNVHHFAGKVIHYLDQNKNFGVQITVSDESDMLLDTGGGLKKAAWFLQGEDPFLVRNADIISDMDLKKMIDAHKQSGAIATLAVRNRETSRYFLFDEGQNLCGWTHRKTGEKILVNHSLEELEKLAFSGIQVISPKIFPLIREEGKFSLTQLYLRLAETEIIKGYLDSDSEWRDIGKDPNAVDEIQE